MMLMKRIAILLPLTFLLLYGCSKGVYLDGKYNMEYDANSGYALPESPFNAFCLNSFDNDGDGRLTKEEIAGIRKIDCSGQNLSSVHGIGIFPALDTLILDNNNISFLNLSELKGIHYLSCKGNLIEELDLRDMSLGTLLCNPMKDPKGNNVLQYIYLRRGQELETLDAPDETYIIELP